MSDPNKTTPPSSGSGATPAACTTAPCLLKDSKLVSLKVISNATQTNVTGPKNWATVKKATEEVVVEATTNPNTEDSWKAITWSGESVPGAKPNQRKVSRAASKKLHIEAKLGGVKDFVDVWVVWAKVTIHTAGTTPPNSVQYSGIEDGTENLGAVTWKGGTNAAGKVAPVAEITPKGVHDVVKAGWDFKRERISHDWIDGVKNTAANYWNTTWQDDTSLARWKKVIPDTDDKIYDLDGPNLFALGSTDAETYNNFRQWIEWGGNSCSDKAEWFYRSRWDNAAATQIILNEVGTGNIALPDKSHFHP